MSLLAIDAGNTRIKWAVKEDNSWTKHGFSLKAEASSKLKQLVTVADEISVANVGDQEQTKYLENLLKGSNCKWIKTLDKFEGLEIKYDPISSFGVDRWCALLAMKKYYESGIVIMAGTAIVIDYLPKSGIYSKGMILPGKNTMLGSITQNTNIALNADIFSLDEGKTMNTALSVKSGIEYALSGALKLFISNNDINNNQVVISGGDATWLSKFIPNAIVDSDLIYKGIELSTNSK